MIACTQYQVVDSNNNIIYEGEWSKERGSESSLNFLFLNEDENVATNYANETNNVAMLTELTMNKMHK